ncbi:unnamed protein product, partial [Penicillium salamii]
LLYASGFLFLGATEEQMVMLNNAGIMHVSYVLILYSVAFIVFLFVNVLLHIYAVHAWPNSESTDQNGPKYTTLSANANGHARSASQQIQDAEAFELHGLISDDEEGPSMGPRKNSDEELGKEASRH